MAWGGREEERELQVERERESVSMHFSYLGVLIFIKLVWLHTHTHTYRLSLHWVTVNLNFRQASSIKPLMAEQRRHVLCVGDGGNWTHSVQVKRLDPAFALTTWPRGLLNFKLCIKCYGQQRLRLRLPAGRRTAVSTQDIRPLGLQNKLLRDCVSDVFTGRG